jgi:hypothetical protein
MKQILLLTVVSTRALYCPAQADLSKLFPDSSLRKPHEAVISTFKSSRLLMGNTNETARKHTLVFFIEHRFDDLAGSAGGIKTFFGFDLATDINISFDYGITDRLTLGAGRCKGAPDLAFNSGNGNTVFLNSQTQLWNASLKYKVLVQTQDNHIPVSVTLYGNAVISTMAADTAAAADAIFSSFGDRLSFAGQFILARKFTDRFSAELLTTLIHRNEVAARDDGNNFSVGAGGRYRYNVHQSVIMQYFIPLRSATSRSYYSGQGVRFYDPWAIGWEAETGGHVFQVLFTNATAASEVQYIPYTTKSWAKGQFRWGFNLSRTFAL